MEIKIEVDHDVIIMKLSGNLVASTMEAVKGQMAKLIEKRYVKVVFDLSRVDFIDSSGLGTCIAANRDLTGRGGGLVCAGLNEGVRKLFQMTRADQKIPVVSSVVDALALMSAGAR